VKLAAACAALILALPVKDTALPKRTPARSLAAPSTFASLSRSQVAFLDTLEERTFRWFWDLSDSTTGLTPDRAPTHSFVSVGAMGFALTAYPIGAERRWVTRAQAAERTLRTLRFMWRAPQDSLGPHTTGYRGFFYHFLDPATGDRFEKVELSTIDTALLLAGALFCQSYFDRAEPREAQVRALAESLYTRADWAWTQPRAPKMSLGWSPEEGFLPYDWGGYNEALLEMILALGSPTHPVDRAAYDTYIRGYRWGTFYGYEHVGFAPLFGHQYPHTWIDFRHIQDDSMRARGIDYYENARRATRAQRAYAIANPAGFRGYGKNEWGLTACDGPLDQTLTIDGRKREFHTYEARGASHVRVTDDGTLCPAALGGSVPYAPLETVTALMAIRARYGEAVYSTYGFVDAFNPTLNVDTKVAAGQIVVGTGWFDTDRLGIDQGPMLAMIENARTGIIWRTMCKNPHLIRGLKRAGFRGGWLDKPK
jgi:hypothetical protein